MEEEIPTYALIIGMTFPIWGFLLYLFIAVSGDMLDWWLRERRQKKLDAMPKPEPVYMSKEETDKIIAAIIEAEKEWKKNA